MLFMKTKGIYCLILVLLSFTSVAQSKNYRFESGFIAKECDDMLKLNFAFLDTTPKNQFEGFLPGYKFIYRSPGIGLDNAWDMWVRNDSTIVLVLRGTTANPKSILADFYCAMVPADGSIVFAPDDTLKYQLAAEKKAVVHAGFLIGFGYLAKDFAPKLDSLYQKGFHNYLVTGHSQGGALCYYISAWLNYLKKNGKYPRLGVKTYASAPPKMGNMYFAYDYDNITHAEWAFSIINTADPVPEFPFTTQQFETDMNEPNPMLNLIKRFEKAPSPLTTTLKKGFIKMQGDATRSSKTYQKYFGTYCRSLINQMLPGLSIPEPVNTTYFVRPGVTISLLVNDAYFKRYESDNDGPYYHHGVNPYRFLLRQYYEGLDKLEE